MAASQKLDMSLDDIINKQSDSPRAGGSGGKIRGSRQRGPSRQPYSRDADDRRGSSVREDRERSEIAEDLGADFIKVSGTSNVKSVAGRIAHATRRGSPPAVLAIGHNSLNQAIKAIAIARRYLQSDTDAVDLSCQPAFRDRQMKASLALYLEARSLQSSSRGGEAAELTVSGSSNPHTVAGALAARVREKSEVEVTAIGADAVANAIRAVCHTRLYLEEDKVDIKCLPEFVEVKKEGLQLSAVRFTIVVEAVV